MDLTNKVALVSGGARDIGASVSKKLASLGAKVVINYFGSSEEAQKTQSDIKNNGGEAITVYGDMTKSQDIKNLVDQAVEEFGDEIHILVNVAGGLVSRKKIEEIDKQFFEKLIDVNLRTAFFLTKGVKPYMPSGSSIINFSSQAARDGGGPGASLYAASKGAVTTLTRSWAKEFGKDNIRVNAVCPGMIATTFHDTFTKSNVREKVANSTPLGREGRANEVADLVAYLASSESSFINGANIDINGGLAFS